MAGAAETLYMTSSDVKWVSRHTKYQHPDGFYPIGRAVVDLWVAISTVWPSAAKALAIEWLASPNLMLRRMELHASRPPFFSTSEVAEHLLTLSDEEFWLSDARRETMQLSVYHCFQGKCCTALVEASKIRRWSQAKQAAHHDIEECKSICWWQVSA